ncbi:MAG: hypothetical protein MUE40_08335 [Anaerolineae bacterium]|nr:hypothetical protein [Anaerolineae bacterium]
MSNNAQQLFQDALLAADTNPAKAADLLKQVVELDPENVPAWVALLKVLTDPEDRRIALSTIAQLDPDNPALQTPAAGSAGGVDDEAGSADAADSDEFVPGISRRELRLTIIGLGVFTVVILGMVLLLVGSINGQRAAEAAALAALVAGQTATQDTFNASNTQVVETQAAVAAAATATFQALVSPTPTATSTRAFELPTPIPPTPTPTEVVFQAVLPPPPANLPGRIYAWGGRNVRSRDFLEFRVYPLSGGGSFERVNSDLVQYPSVDSAGQRVVYMQFNPDGWLLSRISLTDATQPEQIINTLIPRAGLAAVPRLSADGNRLAVIGRTPQDTGAVYLIDLVTNNAVLLTTDAANYRSAVVAPSGAQVVAVREDATGTDLVLIDVTQPNAGFPQTPLTTDGSASIEAHPAFAPNGASLAYSVAPPDRPAESDLYLLQIVGNQSAGSLPIMTVDGDDIHPVFDPTGQFIAFASNRVQGVYNLFVYDITGRLTYQLTASPDPVYPGAWSN